MFEKLPYGKWTLFCTLYDAVQCTACMHDHKNVVHLLKPYTVRVQNRYTYTVQHYFVQNISSVHMPLFAQLPQQPFAPGAKSYSLLFILLPNTSAP